MHRLNSLTEFVSVGLEPACSRPLERVTESSGNSAPSITAYWSFSRRLSYRSVCRIVIDCPQLLDSWEEAVVTQKKQTNTDLRLNDGKFDFTDLPKPWFGLWIWAKFQDLIWREREREREIWVWISNTYCIKYNSRTVWDFSETFLMQ